MSDTVLSSEELLIAGYILYKEKKAKQLERRIYMKQYYINRKLNGFIKTKEKERSVIRLERVRGDVIIEFK